MGELWSIALDSGGVGVCALSLDASYRSHFVAFSTSREAGCPAVSIANLLHALGEGLQFLEAQSAKAPLVLALSGSSRTSACFVDRAFRPLGPVFLGHLPPVSLREIPDFFAQDPSLATAYRNSPLRRLQQLQPAIGLDAPLGLATLSSLVTYWLTGEHADACQPLGVPKAYPSFPGHDSSALIYKALGFCAELCAKPLRYGHFVAEINADPVRLADATHPLLPLLTKLKAVPLFQTGDTRSGFAYATASDPLSWAVELGWQTQACWNAEHDVLSRRELSIVKDKTPLDVPTEDAPSTNLASREALTSLWAEAWGAIDIRQGPRRTLSSYGPESSDYRSPLLEVSIDTGQQKHGLDILGDSSVGSHGLHIYNTALGLQMTGLAAYHTKHDLSRALFESQVYHLRHLRSALDIDGLGPLRISFSPPWSASFASLATDILNCPVYLLACRAPTLAALGSALALARDLDILYTQAQPSLKASVIEPGQRSQSYHAHFRNHQHLLALFD